MKILLAFANSLPAKRVESTFLKLVDLSADLHAKIGISYRANDVVDRWVIEHLELLIENGANVTDSDKNPLLSLLFRHVTGCLISERFDVERLRRHLTLARDFEGSLSRHLISDAREFNKMEYAKYKSERLSQILALYGHFCSDSPINL